MVSSENSVGNLFYGSKGYMTKNVNEWQTFIGKERADGEKGSGLGDHYRISSKRYVQMIRNLPW